MTTRARLLVDCPDRPGIVAATSGLLARHRANIVELDQHATGGDPALFFSRIVVDVPGGAGALDALRAAFATEVARPHDMTWRLVPVDAPRRVVILVSREAHCLTELLWRWERGELGADIACVISNHPDHRERVERFGIPYHHVPATRANRPEAEAEILRLIAGSDSDLVVLARYMQILTRDLLDRVGRPVINIHHSFLPAFVGAEPYRQARDRGVKIVGATAHYVTEELDAGPIIEQDVVRIDHRATLEELVGLGADVERQVFGRAVRWHLQDRVIVHGRSTVVF
ncbi:MAG: formyltetrahydrofolate deformylase [Solirubrobacteraceae bacterium]